MKSLTLDQTQRVSGGSLIKVLGWTIGSVLLASAFAGLFALTAGAGAVAIAAAATGASLTPASWGLACFTDYWFMSDQWNVSFNLKVRKWKKYWSGIC